MLPVDWVFFDMGGVLVDDEPAMLLIYRKLFERCRAKGHCWHHDEMFALRERLISEGDGAHWHTIGKRFLGEDGWRVLHRELIDLLRPRYLELNIPFAGISGMLAETAAGFDIGLAANQLTECRSVLASNGWIDYFKVFGISEEVGYWKPEAEFFRWVLGKAGVDPERCIMVGDRVDNDIVPAKALGMRTILLQMEPDYSLIGDGDDFARAYAASHKRAAIKRAGPADESETPDYRAGSPSDVLRGIKLITGE